MRRRTRSAGMGAYHKHRNLMEEPANDVLQLLRDKIFPRTTLMSNSRWL